MRDFLGHKRRESEIVFMLIYNVIYSVIKWINQVLGRFDWGSQTQNALNLDKTIMRHGWVLQIKSPTEFIRNNWVEISRPYQRPICPDIDICSEIALDNEARAWSKIVNWTECWYYTWEAAVLETKYRWEQLLDSFRLAELFDKFQGGFTPCGWNGDKVRTTMKLLDMQFAWGWHSWADENKLAIFWTSNVSEDDILAQEVYLTNIFDNAIIARFVYKRCWLSVVATRGN